MKSRNSTGIKSRPVVYTHELITTIRRNVSRYNWAKRERRELLARVLPFLNVPPAKFLRWMPSPNMHRSMPGFVFGICPQCGRESGVFDFVDIVHQPWFAKCDNCGLPYDLKPYFLSGLDQRGWFHEKHADDTLLPHGKKARSESLRAFHIYCYIYWSRYLSRWLPDLGLAYVFTGDTRYAEYAVALMSRLADIYPFFDKRDVSGDTHPGAMIQDGWEGPGMMRLALAYDAVFPLLHDSTLLTTLNSIRTKRGLCAFATGKDLQKHIEQRIYAVIAGDRCVGNYIGYGKRRGVMRRIFTCNAHRAHIPPETIGMVLGNTPLGRKYIAQARLLAFKGFNRDGSSMEGALGYDLPGFRDIIDHQKKVARFLPESQHDTWSNPTILAAYQLYFDLYCLDCYYPHFGDTSTAGEPNSAFLYRRDSVGFGRTPVQNRKVACDYALAYQETGIEMFARIAWHLNGRKANGLHLTVSDNNPESVAERIEKVVRKSGPPPEADFVAPYLGIAVLKSGKGKNRRALWMRANRRDQHSESGWHGHADSMSIGLFGHGLNLMPDMGYMDQKPWVFGHNTVSLQNKPVPFATDDEELRPLPILSETSFIHEFPGIHVCRCEGKDRSGVNSRASHRTTFLVNAGQDAFYVIDSFRVAPDTERRYATLSFHSGQGNLKTSLDLKRAKGAISGVSRMKGRWCLPLHRAPREQAQRPWWCEITQEDVYQVLPRASDVKLRFTALRPADCVAHQVYAPATRSKLDAVPYFFMSLQRGNRCDTPCLFSSIIEPHRGERAISDAKALDCGNGFADVIEVTERKGRMLTFVISDGKHSIQLPDGTSVRARAAVIAHKGRGRPRAYVKD